MSKNKEKKAWSDCAIAAKAEWEGVSYVLTDIDPDEVEDPELADWIRVGKVAYEQIFERIEAMSEACDGPDCALCGDEGDEDDEEELDDDEPEELVCDECEGSLDPDSDDPCLCEDEDEEDEA